VVIRGILENVSLNGLLLRCETVLPEQTPCLVFLQLDGGQGGSTIEAQGLARRTNPRKLAVQSTGLTAMRVPSTYGFYCCVTVARRLIRLRTSLGLKWVSMLNLERSEKGKVRSQEWEEKVRRLHSFSLFAPSFP